MRVDILSDLAANGTFRVDEGEMVSGRLLGLGSCRPAHPGWASCLCIIYTDVDSGSKTDCRVASRR